MKALIISSIHCAITIVASIYGVLFHVWNCKKTCRYKYSYVHFHVIIYWCHLIVLKFWNIRVWPWKVRIGARRLILLPNQYLLFALYELNAVINKDTNQVHEILWCKQTKGGHLKFVLRTEESVRKLEQVHTPWCL